MPQRPPSLTLDPIPQLIWRIALPASVGMFFNTLFNLADTYFAGWLSTEALAALSISFPLYFLLIATASGISQGTTSLIANTLGASRLDQARHVFAQSIVFALFLGVLVSILAYLSAPVLFRALGADFQISTTVLSFTNPILFFGVFFVLVMVVNSALAAQGLTYCYRNFLIYGFFANCLLNPVLMWGWIPGLPALGITGIAMATNIVQVAGCFYLWSHVRRTTVFRDLELKMFVPDSSLMWMIAQQALPTALNMLTIAGGIFILSWYATSFGHEAIAALGIATRLEQIVLMPAIGVGTAMLSLTGQNFGARLPARIQLAWRTCLLAGVSLMVLGGIMIGTCGSWFIGFFTTNALVIKDGATYLSVSAFTLAAYPILFVTVFMMQGLKRPGFGLWIGLYRQFIGPFFMIYFLATYLRWGLLGVWWGFSLVTWSAALFALWWGHRQTKNDVANYNQRDLKVEKLLKTSCA